MGDELKKYVDKDRASFDVYDEDLSGLWGQIEQRLESHTTSDDKVVKKKTTLGYLLRVAAMLILVSAVGMTIWLQSTNSRSDNILYRISPELAEAEAFYNDLIAEKLTIIQASLPDSDFYQADFNMLNEAYDDLKKDLKDNADNEEVVQAMITNYKIRLSMLERILEELDKDKDEEADQHINL